MIYLKTFKLSNNKSKNSNIYPFNVLKDKHPDVFLFDNITMLLGVQFIIATYSPFMLGILEAKIYNLDTIDYKVQKWSELENVRYFYKFFKTRESEFKEH